MKSLMNIANVAIVIDFFLEGGGGERNAKINNKDENLQNFNF